MDRAPTLEELQDQDIASDPTVTVQELQEYIRQLSEAFELELEQHRVDITTLQEQLDEAQLQLGQEGHHGKDEDALQDHNHLFDGIETDETQALRVEVEELRAMLNMQGDGGDAEESLAWIQEQLEEQVARAEALEQELEQWRSGAAGADQSAEVERERAKLREELAEMSKRDAAVQEELERRVRQEDVDIANLKAENQTLKQQLSNTESKSNAQGKTIEQNLAKIGALEKECDELRHQSANAVDADKGHSVELENMNMDCEQLRQEQVAAASARKELENTCTSLREQLASASKAAQEESDRALRQRDTDIAQWRAEHETLKQQLSSSESKSNAQGETIEKHLARVGMLEKECEKLRQQSANAVGADKGRCVELENMKMDCEQLRQEQVAAASARAELESTCTSLREQLASASKAAHEESDRALRQRDTDIAQWRAEHETLKQQLSSSESKSNAQGETIEKHLARVGMLEKECAELRQQSANAVEADKGRRAELENMKKDCEQLRQEQVAAASARKELENTCTSLREQLASASKVAQEESDRALRQRDTDITEWRTEHESLKQKLFSSEAKSHAQSETIEKHLARVGMLEKECEELRQQSAKAVDADKGRCVELENMKMDCEQLRQEQVAAASARKELENTCTSLREQLASASKAAQEESDRALRQRDTDIAQWRAEHETLKQQLSSSESKSNAQGETIEKHLARVGMLEKECEELRQQSANAVDADKGRCVELENMRKDREQLRQEQVAAASARAELESTCTSLREQLASASKAAHEESDRALRQRDTDIAQWRAEHETLKQQLSSSESKSNAQGESIEKHLARVGMLENECEELRQQSANAVEADKRHCSTLENMKKDFERLRQEQVAAASARAELEKTCRQLAGAVKAAEAAQEGAKRALLEREIDVAKLKTEIDMLRKQSTGLEATSNTGLRSDIARIEDVKDNSDAKQESNVQLLREELASSKDILNQLTKEAADEIREMQKEMDRLCLDLIAARQASCSMFDDE